MLKFGNMFNRVSLYHGTPATGTEWGRTGPLEYEKYDTIWADVTEISGGEAVAYNGKVTTVSHVIRIHFRTDMLPTDRIGYGGKMLEIISKIDPGNTGRELEIQAVALGDVAEPEDDS